MKILVLQGSARLAGNTARVVKHFENGATSAGHEVQVFNVATMKIAGCTGCECCNEKSDGVCVIADDMKKVYKALEDAEVIVFASPVYYWGFTGALQSTISRFYSIDRPPKAKKYAMILTSHSPNVYEPLVLQFGKIVNYLEGENAGVLTAFGDERTSQSKFDEAFDFGINI